MFSNSSMSAADLAAITKNDDSAWGGSNGIWWIILLFLVFGIGGNGWGNNSGATDNYVLASDFATLQRQIDSTSVQTQDMITNSADQLQRQVTAVADGIASLGYDQLSQMNNINNNIMQSTNTIQNQMATGFCGVNSSIKDLQYNSAMQTNGLQNAMQTGFCQTNYNNANNTRDIIDSQSAGTQAIIARIDRLESNAQQDKIAQLQAENTRLMFAASQQAQNAYLIEQLKTTSV